ncbi:MAG TPA: NAD-dependent deacylase [Candidatus Krumholzibacteria bacterium]
MPDDAFERSVDRAVELLAAARRVVATTGAGMSKESGIPTFRDAQSGLWSNYNLEMLATREGFRRNPPLVWSWYAERRERIAGASPHEGHRALARMEPWFDSFDVLTQNIDGLHIAAGSSRVVELHGSIQRVKCFDANHPASGPFTGDEIPPRCHCGSFLRPDVVWFGEILDPAHLDRAYEAIGACQVMLVIGTSGLVHPAAAFPEAARDLGAWVIEINPEPTPITPVAHVCVRSGARDALVEIEQRLSPARRQGR